MGRFRVISCGKDANRLGRVSLPFFLGDDGLGGCLGVVGVFVVLMIAGAWGTLASHSRPGFWVSGRDLHQKMQLG